MFSLLKEGEDVIEREIITAAYQIAAVNAREAIMSAEGIHTLEPKDITQLIETTESLLNGESPSRSIVNTCLKSALEVSDAYADSAFRQFDSLECQFLYLNRE